MANYDDWEGTEPTNEQVLNSEVEEVDDEDFHESLIYHLLLEGVSKKDPAYCGLIKRLAIRTGLPVDGVRLISGRLITEDLIEPVVPFRPPPGCNQPYSECGFAQPDPRWSPS